MFLPAQEADERKFQQFVNIATLKNLCEHKDERRQAVGLVTLFVYSTVLQSQVCWKTSSPVQKCEGFTQHWTKGASADNYLPLKNTERIETQDQIFFDGMRNYSDVQKKVIPAL